MKWIRVRVGYSYPNPSPDYPVHIVNWMNWQPSTVGKQGSHLSRSGTGGVHAGLLAQFCWADALIILYMMKSSVERVLTVLLSLVDVMYIYLILVLFCFFIFSHCETRERTHVSCFHWNSLSALDHPWFWPLTHFLRKDLLFRVAWDFAVFVPSWQHLDPSSGVPDSYYHRWFLAQCNTCRQAKCWLSQISFMTLQRDHDCNCTIYH